MTKTREFTIKNNKFGIPMSEKNISPIYLGEKITIELGFDKEFLCQDKYYYSKPGKGFTYFEIVAYILRQINESFSKEEYENLTLTGFSLHDNGIVEAHIDS